MDIDAVQQQARDLARYCWICTVLHRHLRGVAVETAPAPVQITTAPGVNEECRVEAGCTPRPPSVGPSDRYVIMSGVYAMTATLSEIISIPGNHAVYDGLQHLLREGSSIAFVGSGASFPLYPLWKQLITELAHEPVCYGLATEADEQYWAREGVHKPLQVCSQVRERLGDPLYHTFLFDTFKDRLGHAGRPYTSAHAALVQSNFRAFLTTNYDPGLLEARRALRTDISTTSFTVWNQSFQVNRWASGDIFRSGPPSPVLFAHGHYSDPEHIILDQSSYRRAYQGTPYRRLFEDLWHQARLVFVGFGFNDLVLAQVADEVLSHTARHGGNEPRHIAILGLPVRHQYSDQMRRMVLEQYHAHPLFYPD